MAYLHSIASTTPQQCVKQEDVQRFACELFNNSGLNMKRLLPIFEKTRIKTRKVLQGFDWYATSQSFTAKNQQFVDSAYQLALASLQKLFQTGDIPPEEIDAYLLVTSSGFVTPTLDARVIDAIGFRNSIVRLPIIGMGCAGGAYSLSRIIDYLAAYPEHKVAVTCVETCTLTFRPADKSKANLVALSLFADGASSAIFSGQPRGDSIQLQAYQSHKWPDSIAVMGWQLEQDGLQVVFDKSIPAIIQKDYANVYSAFLEKQHISATEIQHFLYHPGGAKVLQAFQEVMDKTEQDFHYSYQILSEFGNMSSVTLFFVIERFLQSQQKKGEKGVMAAMGPGFSCEQLLFQTT